MNIVYGCTTMCVKSCTVVFVLCNSREIVEAIYKFSQILTKLYNINAFTTQYTHTYM